MPKLFYVAPVGSECCSPTYTPVGTTVFLSIQHPGELRFNDDEDATSIADAGTSWPDFKEDLPARPALIVLSCYDKETFGN